MMQEVVKAFVSFSLQQVEVSLEERLNLHLQKTFNIEEHVNSIDLLITNFNTKKKRMKYFKQEFNVLMPKKTYSWKEIC